jgi:hypothetical protein
VFARKVLAAFRKFGKAGIDEISAGIAAPTSRCGLLSGAWRTMFTFGGATPALVEEA